MEGGGIEDSVESVGDKSEYLVSGGGDTVY